MSNPMDELRALAAGCGCNHEENDHEHKSARDHSLDKLERMARQSKKAGNVDVSEWRPKLHREFTAFGKLWERLSDKGPGGYTFVSNVSDDGYELEVSIRDDNDEPLYAPSAHITWVYTDEPGLADDYVSFGYHQGRSGRSGPEISLKDATASSLYRIMLKWLKSIRSELLGPLRKAGAAEDDKASKFEEGKPADPTKNMSPEEAAKWKSENEKNKDKFKNAGEHYTSYKDWPELISGDRATSDVKRVAKKFSAEVEKFHKKWFDTWATQISPDLLEADIDYDQLAYLTFQTLVGAGVGLWEHDFLGRKHDSAFEKIVMRNSVLGRLAEELDMEAMDAREETGRRAGWEPGKSDGAKTPKGESEGSDVPDGEGNSDKRAGDIPSSDGEGSDVPDGSGNMDKRAGRHNLYALVLGDGSLFGATDSSRGSSIRYWRVNEPDWAIYLLKGVPEEMATRFVDHGTSAQSFSDGYQAWQAALRFHPVLIDESDEGGRMAAVKKTAAPRGLYGFTVKTQKDCEAAGRKVARSAKRIAKAAYKKDERVATFWASHAKRSKSVTAKILMAALHSMSPRVAADAATAAHKIEHGEFDHRLAAMSVDDLNKLPIGFVVSTPKLKAKKIKNFDKDGGVWEIEVSKITRFKVGEEVPGKHVSQEALKLDSNAFGKKAAKEATTYGLYGYPDKVATLGLTSCTTLRGESGKVASGLHARRRDRHAKISEFFSTHSKKGRCMYSRLLRDSYPDSEMRMASIKPTGVSEWIAWED